MIIFIHFRVTLKKLRNAPFQFKFIFLYHSGAELQRGKSVLCFFFYTKGGPLNLLCQTPKVTFLKHVELVLFYII